MSKRVKSVKVKKVKRGGCGASMNGGTGAVDGVVGVDSRATWAGSALKGGAAPLSPFVLESGAVTAPVSAPVSAPVEHPVAPKIGGRSRRRFRKSRKVKSMKVFPNNIFRNMF